jgi:ADP-heptose:LPS heptosyltransferase
MKILIFSYTGLGNFILKTPLIKFIKNNINNSSIDIICGTPWGVENILKNSDYLNNIYTLPNNASVLKKIKFLCNFFNLQFKLATFLLSYYIKD